MDDLYQILEISKTATADEIKKAYRNLAFKYHPDRNPGDKAAEEKFKNINAAYSVLGDTTKRAQYDQYGSVDQQQAAGSQQNPYGQGYGWGSYQSGGDEFWDWFADTGQRSRQEEEPRNSYSWSSGNKNNGKLSKREAWSLFIQKGLLLVAGIFFLQYSFIIIPFGPFLCIAAIVNGVTGVAKAFHSIFARKEDK